MKTTIEIPDSLYRETKIRAVEQGTTLRKLVIRALERELRGTAIREEAAVPYFAQRKLNPEFAKLLREGKLSGGTDSSDLISEERDAR